MEEGGLHSAEGLLLARYFMYTQEALRSAREALELHLYGMEKEGYEIPEPTPAGKINIPDGGFIEVLDAEP